MGCAGSTKKISKADLNFLLENTKFSKQQIEVWYSGFYQDCPTGELGKTKFIEVYQQLFPNGNANKFCHHIFRTFDIDNSGKIDFKEFLMAINITAKGDPEKKLKWAFKMYDIDGNGEISKAEMFQIIQSIYDLIGLNDKNNTNNNISNNNNNNNKKINSNNGIETDQMSSTINTELNLDKTKNVDAFGFAESPYKRTEQIFSKMDLDKNGSISESEFINGCLSDKYLYQMLTSDYSENF